MIEYGYNKEKYIMIEFRNVSKTYDTGTKAVKNANFVIEKGEFAFLVGSSGSGKSTLIKLILKEEEPTSGNIIINGKDITKLKSKKLDKFRQNELGFIFQDFNLLDTLTAYENIALALTIKGEKTSEIDSKIKEVAKYLEIEKVLDKYPYQMSGGQKQRVASARAIITNPKLILADEPTGALDSKAASALLSMFGEINDEGQTILMVTHSAQAASHASRVLFIKDGEVFHQIYKGSKSRQEMYQMIADTLTILTTGGEYHA